MRRYIRCELFRQIYSVGLMLWSSSQILTNFNCCRPCLFIRCRFNSRPVRLLSESATGFYLVLWDLSSYLSSLLIRLFCCVLRCVAVPVSGSHSKCAGFYLAFYQDFHDFAAPYDDLVWAVVRGGQRRCNCDSSQKYM